MPSFRMRIVPDWLGAWSAALFCALVMCIAGSAAEPSLADREEQAIRAAVDHVAPSVVRIETVGGLERVGELLVGTGPTTGLIVAADGLIVSSAFNFVQKPDSILVTLADGTRLPAKLLATDHSRSLVALRVKAEKPLPVPEEVPASEMRAGQWAVAVGRTFEADKPNVSVGIVSALDRVWGRAIQTDAKISPANYGGPLIDISGRVLGILAPLSPDSASEIAGVDWYDSGIGFAIPLTHVQRVLPKLADGQDLYAGILGINLKGADLFSQPAVIAATRVNSPAYKADLQAGDTVVEINGRPVTRQAQLKQELNRHYAGEKVKLVVLRSEKRVEYEIELVDKLEAYEFPFLGLLPIRPVAGQPEGLVVRYVYADSPAANAGLKVDDQIVSLGKEPIKDSNALAEALRKVLPGERVTVEVRREGKTLPLEIQAGRLPSKVPDALPPAHAAAKAFAGERPAVGVVEIKIPEFKNECIAYVPADYNPELNYGVIVWLHPPGGFKQDELLARWQKRCDQNDLILLAPKSVDATKWEPGEVKFVRRALDDLLKAYKIDRTRIVAAGQEAGGAMAVLLGFNNQDVVRGIAAVAAPMPALTQAPETDPVHRLALYILQADKSASAKQVEAAVKKLGELKFPVTVQSIGDQPRALNDSELDEMLRWLDTLDRL